MEAVLLGKPETAPDRQCRSVPSIENLVNDLLRERPE
jgi:hypothetical protein